ncbi:MAG: hypothetical protein A3C11_01950 [Candidatus Sungbacteria bacterium RIFCSPHIGHO2_02_FULL_49_12]|uniref:Uncharacterized protein n=1 Tax=Candidatus Sungbacteria bacterium RIFCSPHIGHO2_02_FULL_49_12 TaxID=1802271 RepID=A0A1G2KL96_9BACT|nr:MAG: hypothetical protein A3C11_01950 [Candidatus Sungbacteria bacterium RIFCSPHIGHO2_02_FULL_49_12]
MIAFWKASENPSVIFRLAVLGVFLPMRREKPCKLLGRAFPEKQSSPRDLRKVALCALVD